MFHKLRKFKTCFERKLEYVKHCQRNNVLGVSKKLCRKPKLHLVLYCSPSNMNFENLWLLSKKILSPLLSEKIAQNLRATLWDFERYKNSILRHFKILNFIFIIHFILLILYDCELAVATNMFNGITLRDSAFRKSKICVKWD